MGIKTLKSEIKTAGGNYKMQCTAGNNSIILDEPEELGGSNGGMNPGEALLSALGGCKYIIARMFYQKFNINLIGLCIDVEGEIDMDALMNTVEKKNRNKDLKIGFSKITTKWFIDANNTKEEIEKFVEFVEAHCPMKDTIEDKPDFSVEVLGKKH